MMFVHFTKYINIAFRDVNECRETQESIFFLIPGNEFCEFR